MKETERKDKTTGKTDEKAGGHLVLFVRRNAVYIAVFLIGAAFLLAAGSFDWDRINSYTMYNNDSRTFVRGRGVSVDNERLETDPYDHSRYLGEQELTVLILDGEQKGDKVSIDNYLSQTHNIYVNANQKKSYVQICRREQLPTTQYSIMTGACHLASLWWYLPR